MPGRAVVAFCQCAAAEGRLFCFLGFCCVWRAAVPTEWTRRDDRPPNFILILADDMGYGDLGCFGSQKHRTPHLDRMADEGIRLTSFYSTSGVCTPSRASLMTGCYPRRVSMHQDADQRWVLFPGSATGLNPDEVTIAEVLKQKGYATATIGKWHLGDQPEFLPTRQGFDFYFGLPYSNDLGKGNKNFNFPPLPLMNGEKVIEVEPDQAQLTRRYTAEAIRFIQDHRNERFLLFFSHTMPHVPVAASPQFAGKSANGRYGDAIEEIDWSVGEILKTLQKLGIDGQSMVIFTSDNGPERSRVGSTALLRGQGDDPRRRDAGPVRRPLARADTGRANQRGSHVDPGPAAHSGPPGRRPSPLGSNH